MFEFHHRDHNKLFRYRNLNKFYRDRDRNDDRIWRSHICKLWHLLR